MVQRPLVFDAPARRMPRDGQRLRVLLVGGGHAMLPALRDAAAWGEGAEVTLLDASRHLYYSGMVPEYLGGVYTREEVTIDLAETARAAGVRFVEAAATRLDPARRVVHTASGDTWPYDLAAFDIGARPPAFPSSEGAEGPIPTKPLFRIEALEAQVRATLASASARLRLVVVGGGAAGVEIVLNLTSRFAAHGRSADLAVTILERGPDLLSAFPPSMRAHARAVLERRGVRVATTTAAADVTGRGVRLPDDAVLDADAVLWATGTVGPPLFADAGLPTDARGFVQVEPSMHVAGHPRLLAAGDAATVLGVRRLAKVGVHAVKQGPVLRDRLARALAALHDGVLPDPNDGPRFAPYPVAPLVLSTGVREGWWVSGRAWLRHRAALHLKHWIDRRWIRAYAPAWQRRPLAAYASADAARDAARAPFDPRATDGPGAA